MSSRGRIPLHYDGRAVQDPGMLRHGHRLLESRPRPELLEDKIAVQAAEIEQLAGDNHRLAASHITMREDLAAAQKDIPRLKAQIRSIHTESDIQIRVLLDKIEKMEADIKAGERLKKDLQQVHIEAQSLARARQELTPKIQQASEELHKARLEVKCLPDLHAELDSLRQEHQRLRDTFEYEKGVNIENVEQLQAMEKNLIGMAKEMEKLQAEVKNAEMRANAPNPYSETYVNPNPSYPLSVQGGGMYVVNPNASYPPSVQGGGTHVNHNPSYPNASYPPSVQGGGTHVNPNPSYPPSVQGGGMYIDGYDQPLAQMGVVQTGDGMIPYDSGNGVGSAAVPASVVGAVWGGPYDPSIARR